MPLNLKSALENAAENNDYSPIQEGRYDYLIERGELKTASTGTEMMELTFVCETAPYANRKVWHSFPLTESAQIYIVRFLEAVGMKDMIEDGLEATDIIKAVTGKKVSAYTEIQAGNNGKNYNRLKNFQPVAGGESNTSSSPGGLTPNAGTAPKKKALFK